VLVEIVFPLVKGISPGCGGTELESAAVAAGPAAFRADAAVRGRVAVQDAVAAHAYAHLGGQVGELVGEVGAVVSAVGHDPDRLVSLAPPSKGDDPGDDLAQLAGGVLLDMVAGAQAVGVEWSGPGSGAAAQRGDDRVGPAGD